MKGIILAGGKGTRLAPLTDVLNKHLLPVYNKPMIYYSLATLIVMGIREILLTTHFKEMPLFQALLGDGSKFGIKIIYKEQKDAGGIAEVLLLADDFIKEGERFIMFLGDNIFHIPSPLASFSALINLEKGAGIVLCDVHDPSRFGIAEVDSRGKVISIEEKPEEPKSNLAITGLYFYDRKALEFAKKISRSARGELEISDINSEYLKLGGLTSIALPKDSFWIDTGTVESLLKAGEFIKIIETKEGIMIGSPEEASLKHGFITKDILRTQCQNKKGEYYEYLQELCK